MANTDTGPVKSFQKIFTMSAKTIELHLINIIDNDLCRNSS